MDSARGQVFYDWCYLTIPECHTTHLPYTADVCVMDVQSFLRWHGQDAASPRALLDLLHEHVSLHMPNSNDHSLHLGVMNTSFEADRTETTDGTVQAHLYTRHWDMAHPDTIATALLDDPRSLEHWPFAEPELRMVHFDWTVFAWQWRLLVSREVRQRQHQPCRIYNGLNMHAAGLVQGYRRRLPASKEREIAAAMEADSQSVHIHITQGSGINSPGTVTEAADHTHMQFQWRGLLSAMRTLFARKNDATVNSYYLHTCAPDGLWLAVVCALHAYEQGDLMGTWTCQWREQPLVDVTQIALALIKRFKETRAALTACLMFWVDTQCVQTTAYTNVFDRLEQGSLRPSKGAEFTLVLGCMTHGRDHTVSLSRQAQGTCNALCRALWQRTLVGATYEEQRPEHVVYPRMFWEAWGVTHVPDFTPVIAQCIQWINFANMCLVNDNLDMHFAPQATTTTPHHPHDMLYYGLASHVDGTHARLLPKTKDGDDDDT